MTFHSRFWAGWRAGGRYYADTRNYAQRKSGYATTLVVAVGGPVVAFFIAQYFDWRASFFIGGGLGLSLLLLRVGVSESGMFGKAKKEDSVRRGNFFSLFVNKERFFKYLRCITIGVPLWFVVRISITLSTEFGKVLGVHGEVNAGAAVAWCLVSLAAPGSL